MFLGSVNGRMGGFSMLPRVRFGLCPTAFQEIWRAGVKKLLRPTFYVTSLSLLQCYNLKHVHVEIPNAYRATKLMPCTVSHDTGTRYHVGRDYLLYRYPGYP